MTVKTRIVISSILKPVFDPRNYKKIAISLANSGNYEVFITGYPQTIQNQHHDIQVISLSKFPRMGLSRLLKPISTFRNWIKVKPHVIIVNTHELLGVSFIYKILFGAKIIYDIQENYYKNLIYSHYYFFPLKLILAHYIRLKEIIFSKLINGFILAEKCYQQELSFLKNNFEVLENKYVHEEFPMEIRQKDKNLRFIYSGTIASEYGIFDAIHFIQSLHEKIPSILFTIIGYCPNEITLLKIRELIAPFSYINLIGGDELVPHHQIIKEIQHSDLCLLPYFTDTYYSNRIPTKIYEGLSLKKPMIIRNNAAWMELIQSFDAFIFSDFKHIDENLIEQIMDGKFYKKGDTKQASWENEVPKLLRFIKKFKHN